MMNTETAKPSAIERCQNKLGELGRRFLGQVAGTVLTGIFAAASGTTALVYGIESVSNLSEAAPTVTVEASGVSDLVNTDAPLISVQRQEENVTQHRLSAAGENATWAVTAGGVGALLAFGSAAFGFAAGGTRRKIESVQDALKYHREQEAASRPRDFA